MPLGVPVGGRKRNSDVVVVSAGQRQAEGGRKGSGGVEVKRGVLVARRTQLFRFVGVCTCLCLSLCTAVAGLTGRSID